MGGIKSSDERFAGQGVAQDALFKGMDSVFADMAIKGVTRADLEDMQPAGRILEGEAIEPKPELLGDPAVALVMGAFPGAEIIKD